MARVLFEPLALAASHELEVVEHNVLGVEHNVLGVEHNVLGVEHVGAVLHGIEDLVDGRGPMEAEEVERELGEAVRPVVVKVLELT